MPRVYRVLFADGHEGDAVEDELLTGPQWFSRAAPPKAPGAVRAHPDTTPPSPGQAAEAPAAPGAARPPAGLGFTGIPGTRARTRPAPGAATPAPTTQARPYRSTQ